MTNTIVNFAVLNLSFYILGQGKIISSVIATGCAFLCSFILNRSFVFRAREVKASRQILPFVIITAIGSLGLLNLVYVITLYMLQGHEWLIGDTVTLLTGLRLSSDFILINTSAVMGSLVTMLWNYNGYRLFVFGAPRPKYERIEADAKTDPLS